MTRNRAYALTAFSAGLYVVLCWIFADGLFSSSNLYNSHELAGSSLLTYAAARRRSSSPGIYQARTLPAEGIDLTTAVETGRGQIDDPVSWKLLLGNVFFALIWMPVRFFVGQEWLAAGEHKVRDDAWMNGGTALQGYWERAVAIPEQGRPAITYGWFRDFLQYMLDHEWYTWFAKVIAVGEVLIGHRPDRRRAGRDRRLLRHADELQLPAGRLGQHQPGALRARASSWSWPGRSPGSGDSTATCCRCSAPRGRAARSRSGTGRHRRRPRRSPVRPTERRTRTQGHNRTHPGYPAGVRSSRMELTRNRQVEAPRCNAWDTQ